MFREFKQPLTFYLMNRECFSSVIHRYLTNDNATGAWIDSVGEMDDGQSPYFRNHDQGQVGRGLEVDPRISHVAAVGQEGRKGQSFLRTVRYIL